jgi:hypothetical protein
LGGATSKDGLVRALLSRGRTDELALLDWLMPNAEGEPPGLETATAQVWSWLRVVENRPLLRLWAEADARSLVEPDGAWAGFATATVNDWLEVLTSCQSPEEMDSVDGVARRTLTLAVLRGCLLDLLATGGDARVDAALHHHLALLSNLSATSKR